MHSGARSKPVRNNIFQTRNNRGGGIIALSLVLFILLIIIGLFVYDMNRMQMAQRQLTALCDAAALTGSAMLSSQDVSYGDQKESVLYTAQTNAINYAQNMFSLGVILGTRLYNPAVSNGVKGIAINSVSSAANLNSVAPNQVNVWIQLADPLNSYAIHLPGNVQGRSLFIQACYGYVPSLCSFTLPVFNLNGSVPVSATSTAATQELNVIMVFDCSASMDDNTAVSFVYRTWDTNFDGYNYQTVGNAGSHNQLWQYSGLDYAAAPNGTALNVLPPQNLTNLGYVFPQVTNGVLKYNHFEFNDSQNYFGPSPSTGKRLAFDMSMRAYCSAYNVANSYPVTQSANGLFQGPWFDNDFGAPPGNCPYKYGNQQGNLGKLGTSNPNWATTNAAGIGPWDGTANHGWGPDSSPGYYRNAVSAPYSPSYNPNYVDPNNPNNSYDPNIYFYDPNAIPPGYTAATYSPFTDLVVNLVDTGWRQQNQPLQGSSCPYGGTNVLFDAGNYYVWFSEGGTNTSYLDTEGGVLRGLTFQFPNIAWLCEASRGNLDLDINGNANNYKNALLGYKAVDANNNNLPLITDCKRGYQKAYQRAVMYLSQPIATARLGAFKFFQNLAENSSAYFGFVGFSTAPTNAANPDVCAYLYNSGFPTSLFLSCAGTPTAQYPTGADFFYHGYVKTASSGNLSVNPNVWMWSPTINIIQGGGPNLEGPEGPAASPTGIPYSAALNPGGPGSPTWMNETFGDHIGLPPANLGSATDSRIRWAYSNLGFQIPRCLLYGGNDISSSTLQQATFNGVCNPNTIPEWTNKTALLNGGGALGNVTWYTGTNGLWHTRPIGNTDAMEALQTALADVGVGDFGALTNSVTTINNQRPGAANVIVFFTDGVPTDVPAGDFSGYINNVAKPAQKFGIPIYSIGLALNSYVKTSQHDFLTMLTNNGACGSQFFQVTDATTLKAAFTSISKQLTQCQR